MSEGGLEDVSEGGLEGVISKSVLVNVLEVVNVRRTRFVRWW